MQEEYHKNILVQNDTPIYYGNRPNLMMQINNEIIKNQENSNNQKKIGPVVE
jgi:hypothetical protein